MRASTLILLTGLATCAAACSSVTRPEAPVAAMVSSGAPTPVADLDWFFHSDGPEARLVYGLAESDDLRLGLDCREGSGRLALSAVAGPAAQPEIHLESGGDMDRLPATAEPSGLHDGVFLTAESTTDAPVFRRFRQLGWIALWMDGERQAFAPHPGSLPGIERFFAFCG